MGRITIVTGDITNQPDVDVIVNAANAQLRGGSGVCGAIFKAAGWDRMQESCNEHLPDANGVRCPVGECRTTPAHDLPNKAVIHAVGPIYNPEPLYPHQNVIELGNAYVSSIMAAGRIGHRSIAFPAISCGIYGYPLEEAARVALQTIRKALRILPQIEEVRFVFLPFGDGPEVQEVFETMYEELKNANG